MHAVGFHKPVEVALFTAPPREHLFNNHTWEKEIVDNCTFPLAHGVQVMTTMSPTLFFWVSSHHLACVEI